MEMSQGIKDPHYEENFLRGSLNIIKNVAETLPREDFANGKNIEEFLSSALPRMKIPQAVILCERHYEYLPVFMAYFEKEIAYEKQNTDFIPFLIHIIPFIPIQWGVIASRQFSEARWASFFLNNFFKRRILMQPGVLDFTRNNNNVWEKYKALKGLKKDITVSGAWNDIFNYCTAARELIDYKISYKFSEYIFCYKKDFVRNIIMNTSSAARLLRSMKKEIIPYSRANGIDYEYILIKVVSKKSWNVRDKLRICTEFIQKQIKKEDFLHSMTFNGEKEFLQIKDYAQKNNIKYDPDMEMYTECIQKKEEEPLPFQRSESVDLIRLTEGLRKLPKTAGIPHLPRRVAPRINSDEPVLMQKRNRWKRSPSIEVNLNLLSEGAGKYSQIADGRACSSSEYANKLEKFRNLKEIRPIYDLASNFDLVVSYDEFSDSWKRHGIFEKLISRDGWKHLDNIVEILSLDAVEAVKNNAEYAEEGNVVLPLLLKHVTSINAEVFLNFTNKCIKNMFDKSIPTSQIIPLWINCLSEVFTKIEGSKVDKIVLFARLLNAIKEVDDDGVSKKAIFMFDEGKTLSDVKEYLLSEGKDKAANELINVKEGYSKEDFLNDIMGSDIMKLSQAVIQIRFGCTKEESVDFLKEAVQKISGTQYSNLSYAYSLLSEFGEESPKDVAIIQAINLLPKHEIDYHKLLQDPLTVLKENSTPETLESIIEVSKFFDIERDELIMNVMTSKVTSSFINDYQKYIDMLDNKKHGELFTVIAPRLKKEDLPLLYSSLGMIDEHKKTQTILDLNYNGLSDFVTPKGLENPKKLICDIYNDQSLHDRFGKRLHNILQNIAFRYQLDIKSIHNELIYQWLEKDYIDHNEEEEKEGETLKVFASTDEDKLTEKDTLALRLSLYILRSKEIVDSLKFLKKIVDEASTPRCKCRAIGCMFLLSDESDVKKYCGNVEELNSTFTRTLMCAHANAHGANLCEEDFLPENVKETLEKFNEPWADMMKVTVYMNDNEKLVGLIQRLSVTRPVFVIKTIPMFAKRRELIEREDFFDSLVRAMSRPIEAFANKEITVKNIEERFNATIFRSLCTAISQLPSLYHLYINGKKEKIEDVIELLCTCGCSKIAAEIGARITDDNLREIIIERLVNLDHYDHALHFGFDEDKIFEIIVKTKIEEATQAMLDDSFYLMIGYIHRTNNAEALEKVYKTLLKQGRSKEIQRVKDRIAELDAKLAKN